MGGALSAAGAKEAAKIQAKAVQQAQQFVYNSLDPAVVGDQALAGDIAREQQRLALQAQLDPALSATRYAAQQRLLEQVQGLGTGPQEVIAQQAAAEAMAAGPATQDLKTRLIDAALMELEAGATLPPDVQAELVQAGLEKSGMVTGRAGPTGIGGTLLRREIGQGALRLQGERQARAMNLAQSASALDAQRQQILQNLFPALQAKDLANMSAASGALGTSASLVPEAGLSGADLANVWLARVGATSQLGQQLGAVKAAGALGAAQAWAPAIGQAVGTLGNTVGGWFTRPSAPSSTQGAVDRSLYSGLVSR